MRAPSGVRQGEFDPGRLVAAKSGRRVTVGLPARDEAATVGAIVGVIRRELMERTALVDEILVLDDHSTDRTAEVAAAQGARVIHAREVLSAVTDSQGKGEALWRLTQAASGDLLVFCDADIVDFGSRFVVGLVGPLLDDPNVAFVKGAYTRPGPHGDHGGRVTELLARPLLATLFPHLADIEQPLSGEYAARRSVLMGLPFARGYGVDLGLLIDVAASVGRHRVVQVDLGTRRHRNRPLAELGPQALDVLHAGLSRADVLVRGLGTRHRPGSALIESALGDLPPLRGLAVGDEAVAS